MHSPHGIKLLTRLEVGLYHLCEHKFRHNFQDSLDPFYNCGRHIETTIHFFLHFSNYSNQGKTLLEKISNIKRSLLNQKDSIIVETLPFWIECPQRRRECMDNTINSGIYCNHGKVRNNTVMNLFFCFVFVTFLHKLMNEALVTCNHVFQHQIKHVLKSPMKNF